MLGFVNAINGALQPHWKERLRNGQGIVNPSHPPGSKLGRERKRRWPWLAADLARLRRQFYALEQQHRQLVKNKNLHQNYQPSLLIRRRTSGRMHDPEAGRGCGLDLPILHPPFTLPPYPETCSAAPVDDGHEPCSAWPTRDAAKGISVFYPIEKTSRGQAVPVHQTKPGHTAQQCRSGDCADGLPPEAVSSSGAEECQDFDPPNDLPPSTWAWGGDSRRRHGGKPGGCQGKDSSDQECLLGVHRGERGDRFHRSQWFLFHVIHTLQEVMCLFFVRSESQVPGGEASTLHPGMHGAGYWPRPDIHADATGLCRGPRFRPRQDPALLVRLCQPPCATQGHVPGGEGPTGGLARCVLRCRLACGLSIAPATSRRWRIPL